MRLQKATLILATLLLIILGYIFIVIINNEEEDNLPTIREAYTSNGFNMSKLLNGLSESEALQKFPYKEYLQNADYHDYKSISKDLNFIDSVYGKSNFTGQQILSMALTDSLKKRLEPLLIECNFERIDSLLHWIEGFRYYAQVNNETELLYSSIYRYWMSELSNKLSHFSENNLNERYNFKFRYLTTKLKCAKYSVATKHTLVEKFIFNLFSKNWAHLINATWNQASLILKALLFLITAITLLSYIITLKWLLKKIKIK